MNVKATPSRKLFHNIFVGIRLAKVFIIVVVEYFRSFFAVMSMISSLHESFSDTRYVFASLTLYLHLNYSYFFFRLSLLRWLQPRVVKKVGHNYDFSIYSRLALLILFFDFQRFHASHGTTSWWLQACLGNQGFQCFLSSFVIGYKDWVNDLDKSLKYLRKI